MNKSCSKVMNMEESRSPPEFSRPRFRPHLEAQYSVIFRTWDVLFMPTIPSLPSFSFRSSDSLLVVTSIYHVRSPFALNVESLMPHLRGQKSITCFADKTTRKEEFVVQIRSLHLRLRAIEYYIQKQIISSILLDVIMAHQKQGSKNTATLAPLIDLSDEALTQEHYSPPQPHPTLLHEEESAVKDEYNTFDFLALMSTNEAVPKITSSKKSSSKSTQMNKSWNRKRTRQVAQLRIPECLNDVLIFEFVVSGKQYEERISPDSLKGIPLKFENSTVRLPLRELLTVFKELYRCNDSKSLKVKIDIYFASSSWRILFVHLPTSAIPDCKIGKVIQTQVNEKDVQILFQFDDGSSDTIWMNSFDAIDVASTSTPGLNSVEIWPSYLRKYGQWPAFIGLIPDGHQRWKSVIFPRGEQQSYEAVSKSLREGTRKSIKSGRDWRKRFAQNYLQLIKDASNVKGNHSSILTVLSEFLNFIQIPSAAHDEMIKNFMTSRNKI